MAIHWAHKRPLVGQLLYVSVCVSKPIISIRQQWDHSWISNINLFVNLDHLDKHTMW